MPKFILLSVLLPIVFLLSIWLFIKLYEPQNLAGNIPFATQNFSLYAVDGAQLKGTYTRLSPPAKKQPPLILFIADLDLDRDWNAPNLSFHSGHWLAKSLASFGIESIRYDHRGTGQSRASENTKYDFDLKAEDLRVLHAYARKQEPQKLLFLAHGDNACGLLLYALQKWNLSQKGDGLFLLSCGAQGKLLDIWARKLFFNMQRKGVSASIISKAEKEWQLWKKSSAKIPSHNPKKKDKIGSPDLAAFRAALHFLSSEKMHNFRNRGQEIHFYSLLEKQILRRMPVLHIKCRYDEESPPQDQETAFSFAIQMQKKYGTSNSYRFRNINNCNHFLKEESRIVQGFTLSLTRANPLTSLATQVPQEIKSYILNEN